MPDGFALAALSHALRFRVERIIREIDVAVTGQFSIVSRPPEALAAAAPAQATLTLYPYQLLPNTGWESSRPSAYSTDGVRRNDPLLALDVSYVLAGYAPESGDVERALGLALLALHETPQLTPEMLEEASGDNFPDGSPLPQAILDLACQAAPLKISSLPMEIEVASQLWSTLNSGLRTGMAYRVGTILMERRRRRAPAPEVREARLGVVQIRRPTIVRLSFAAVGEAFVERATVEPGESFRALGSGLFADVVRIEIGSRTLAINPAQVHSDRIEGELPADLRPGVSSFRILHRIAKPTGELSPPAAGDIPGERSNIVPIAIRPVLDDPAVTLANRQVNDGVVNFDATVHFAVPVGRRQRLELLLDATAPDGDGQFRSYVFVAPAPEPGTPDAATATRALVLSNVLAGNYLVRVIVDGAESALHAGASGYDGPILTAPA